MQSLPVIDIGPLLNPESTRLDTCVSEFHQALSQVGFLYIKNHGISEALTDQLFSFAREFFAEDLQVKNQIAMKNAGLAWRGYFPVGGELTMGRPDQKEGIYFGREEPVNGEPMHGPNLWPAGAKYADARQSILQYLTSLQELGQTLMGAAALGLGLPRDYFQKRFSDDPTILFRMFNYPQHLWSESADEWGVREHTDMGFLTILKQDKSGGLQVKAKSGEWIMAPPIDGTFVINIGDMLEVWSHGIYRATPHRVRNQAKGDRLSLPFFFDPNWHASLEPIERSLLRAADLTQVSQSTRDRWDGLKLHQLSPQMRYGDFVWEKIRHVFPDLAQ